MKRTCKKLDFNNTRQSQGEKMGKGFWHEVSKARDTLCRVDCPFALVEWNAYEELEFEYSLLKKENEKRKEE